MEEAISKQYSEDKQIMQTIVPVETKNLTVIFCRLCKKVFPGKREYRTHFEIDHKDKLEFAKTHNVEKDLICDGIGYAKGPKFEEIEKNSYCICYVCEKHFSGESMHGHGHVS